MTEENQQTRIMLVDDDKFLLDMYSLKFKKSNFAVEAFPTSTGALERLRTGGVFDLVLLDIIMPTMDGIEVLKHIKDEKLIPEAVIIMLTNQADDFEKAKNLGVEGYIIKATTIPSEVVEQVTSIYNAKKKK